LQSLQNIFFGKLHGTSGQCFDVGGSRAQRIELSVADLESMFQQVSAHWLEKLTLFDISNDSTEIPFGRAVFRQGPALDFGFECRNSCKNCIHRIRDKR